MTDPPEDFVTRPPWTHRLRLFGDAAEGVLNYDWSNTELGALESWPSALALLVEATLASRVPSALALGPRRRLIANARASDWLLPAQPLAAGGDAVAAFSRCWPGAQQAFERAFSGELVGAEAQTFHTPNGRSIDVDVGLAPLYGADGALACVQAQFVAAPRRGTFVTGDDLGAVHEELTAALAESRRRARNTLGIVRSIARRTAETSDSVESCAMHFEGRLDALARVASLAAGSQNAGVPLDALVAEELFAFKAREDAGLHISGPPVRVRPEAAEMLGLAIHELAVNAMNFGALSPAGGRLEITWRMLGRDPDALVLSWIDSGVAARPQPPDADGFGADLIKRGLAYAWNARSQFVLQADGLNCAIELPAAIFLA